MATSGTFTKNDASRARDKINTLNLPVEDFSWLELPGEDFSWLELPSSGSDTPDLVMDGDKTPSTPGSVENPFELPFRTEDTGLRSRGSSACPSLEVISEEPAIHQARLNESSKTPPSVNPIRRQSMLMLPPNRDKNLPELPKHSFERPNGRKPQPIPTHSRKPSNMTTTSLASSGQRTATAFSFNSASSMSSEPKKSSKLGAFIYRMSMRSPSRATSGEELCMEKRTLTPFGLSAPFEELDENFPLPHRSRSSNSLRRPDTTASGCSYRPETAAIAYNYRPGTAGAISEYTITGREQPVFGVSLSDSLKVAKHCVRVSHKGKANSHRIYPTCLYKCCEYIEQSGTVHRDLFSQPGDPSSLFELRTIFNSAPDYGHSVDLSLYTYHTAASLILHYLSSLKHPLVPPSVLKRWILLGRREGDIQPPAPKIENGLDVALDFWIDALNLLPVNSRHLVKHLLHLFAVLCTANGEFYQADAIRLAEEGGVAAALFHLERVGDTGKTRGGWKVKSEKMWPVLAVAFMVRKRAEYERGMGQGKRKRESEMFLPSTREIMEWKEK